MVFTYSKRLHSVQPSMILGLVQRAQEMADQGCPVIDLGIGEPDFTTPEHVKQAAILAIQNDQTKYTVIPGTVKLREAIARKIKRESGQSYELSCITVGSGAKQIIFNAMMATLSKGDEVIIPAPYWSSYPDIVAIADGHPVIVDCPQEQNFLLTASQLAKSITPKTRWLMLNSPSNPTGGVYSPQQLRELADILLDFPQVMVLSDDIYEHLMFDGRTFTSILDVAPELKNRVLLVNGVSKVFAMTGWRVGYACGSKELIASMNTVQGQSTTHASSISQAASIAALDGPTDFFADRTKLFQERRDIAVECLKACPGLEVLNPEGAFYIYPKCAGLIGKKTPKGDVLESDIDVCQWLLEEHHVSTVPGAAFGLSPHMRISTAVNEEVLREACQRILTACNSLEDSQ